MIFEEGKVQIAKTFKVELRPLSEFQKEDQDSPQESDCEYDSQASKVITEKRLQQFIQKAQNLIQTNSRSQRNRSSELAPPTNPSLRTNSSLQKQLNSRSDLKSSLKSDRIFFSSSSKYKKQISEVSTMVENTGEKKERMT